MTLSPLFALVDRLRGEGFAFALVDGRPMVNPASSLSPVDRAFLAGHREALSLWLTFPDDLRPIIGTGVTLADLNRYREALDALEAFTGEERARLLPHEPSRDVLVELAQLKAACGGEVVEVAGPGGNLSTLGRSTNV